MNFCLQTTLACEYASEAGFCMESRCVKILDEILVKAGGSAGKKGPPGACPRCGAAGVIWFSKEDKSFCQKCGWNDMGGPMRVAKCRGCGAPIVWIRTTGGKSMPCDAEPVLYREKAGAAGKIITPNGMVLSCELDVAPCEADGAGYVSHFATCPAAEKFRRKGD